MLALVIDLHLERLQSALHIRGRHGQVVRELLDTALRALGILFQELLDQVLRPVLAVGEEPKIRQRLLWRAELAFDLGELVGELDEQTPVAFALELRQSQDTGHVVAVSGFFFFREIADQVAAFVVSCGHDVEEERVHVVVKSFMIKEHFGQQAEVAAPCPLAPTVDFKKGNIIIPVDFVPRGVLERAFLAVACKGFEIPVITEAELADIKEIFLGKDFRVG